MGAATKFHHNLRAWHPILLQSAMAGRPWFDCGVLSYGLDLKQCRNFMKFTIWILIDIKFVLQELSFRRAQTVSAYIQRNMHSHFDLSFNASKIMKQMCFKYFV